jgi:hypothetical protein
MANEAKGHLAFWFALLVSLCVPACAFRHHRARASFDPSAVQSLVARARELGAAERAPDVLARAEALLEDAKKEKNTDRRRWLERLAMAEANHALSVTELKDEHKRLAEEMARAKTQQDNELEATRQENRKLEDRNDVLLRDLELTETEIIRIKARLKGLETRAEASSAIAEAHILSLRTSRERISASALARCQELIARARKQLQIGNYGAAAFFAHKAQYLLRNALRTTTSRSE